MVLPPCDNDPGATSAELADGDRTWVFYVGTLNGVYAGAAFEVTSSEGYGGDIVTMVGVTADGKVQGIEILQAKETPGLGAKVADDDFRNQFGERSIADTVWAVRKDQGDLDQITAATISSRAVVNSIKEGLDAYMHNLDIIRAAGATAGSKDI